MLVQKKTNLLLLFLAIPLVASIIWLVFNNLSLSLTFDEAVTAKISNQGSLKEVFHCSYIKRPYPPFYFLITHEFSKLLSNEFGLRLSSVIFGILALIAVFFLARALFRTTIGYIAALLFLFTPEIVMHFINANPYTMLVFAVTASACCLYQGLQTNKNRYWFLFVLFAVLSFGTHLFGVFYIAAQTAGGFVLLAYDNLLTAQKNRPIVPVSSIKKLLASNLFILLIWLIWMAYYFTHASYQMAALDLQNISLTKTVRQFLCLYKWIAPGKLTLTAMIFNMLVIAGIIYCSFYERRKAFFLLTLLLIPAIPIAIITAMALGYCEGQYGIGLFPILCVLAASCFEAVKLIEKSRSKLFALSRRLILAALFVYFFISYHNVFHRDYLRNDWKSASRFLNSDVNKNNPVIVYPGYYSTGLDYYLKEGANKLFSVKSDTIKKQTLDEIIINFIREHRIEKGTVFIVTVPQVCSIISNNTMKRKTIDQVIADIASKLENKSTTVKVRKEKFQGVLIIIATMKPKT